METSWHPLGPEKSPEPPERRCAFFPEATKVVRKDDYSQFDRNADLTPEDVLGLLSGEISEHEIKARREKIVFETRVQRMFELLSTVPTHRLLDRYRSRLWDRLRHSYYREEYDAQEIEGVALKRVLDTREHIPRHPRGPGKIRRQKLAKAARGQGKSKNR